MLLSTNITHAEQFNNKNKEHNIQLIYTFDTPIKSKFDDGTDKIIIQGLENYGEPGAPSLPCKPIRVLLPQKSRVDSITISTSKKILLPDTYNLPPVQTPYPASHTGPIEKTVPNPEIYESNESYPNILYKQIGIQRYKGYDILILNLYPIHYMPASKGLYFFTDFKITINTAIDDNNNINQLYRGLEKDKQEILTKVDSYDTITSYEETNSYYSTKDYNLLIITTEPFKDGFQHLADFHNSTGLRTFIRFFGQDIPISDDYNQSCKNIRDYIRSEYENYSIDFVLIGGDIDIIPAIYLLHYDIPSDLYYSCLDGPFNSDGDETWGEPTDGEGGNDVDLFAEVNVGRACVGNTTEVGYFVNKTIDYKKRNIGDEYFQNILIAGEFLNPSYAGNFLDRLINGSDKSGFTTVGFPNNIFSPYAIECLYDRDWEKHGWPEPQYTGHGGWPVEELLQRINEGTHIISHLGHAGSFTNMKMLIEDVIALNNENLCFIYSEGCHAGGFDMNGSGTGDCIAEFFTVKSMNGAFAGIWNSRAGWIGTSIHFSRQFWDAVINESILEISRANQDSKEDNYWQIDNGYIRYSYYELNFFGDPTIAFKLRFNPNHNVGVAKVDVKHHVKYQENIMVKTTIVNSGQHNESDVKVYFYANDELIDSINIPFLDYNTTKNLTFSWQPPSIGTYEITIKTRILNTREEIKWDNKKSEISKVGVLNNNTQELFETIQEAINAINTTDGNIIIVPEGEYYEQILINKNISLIGLNQINTILKGNLFSTSSSLSKSAIIQVRNTENVHISDFTITNGSIGINIITSSNAIINDCSLYNNIQGIHITSNSHNNLIYHNNFKNRRNALDFGRNNSWDNGYFIEGDFHLCGGNWWADYTGKDNLRGPGQNITIGSDGFGDTRYDISGGDNQDTYPLMEPWTEQMLPGIIYIDNSNIQGPWNGTLKYPFRSIQDGIDNVTIIGDIVYVFDGYYQENIKIEKPGVLLLGENKTNTIIDGGNSDNVIQITKNNVLVSGFTIQNGEGGNWRAGVHISSDNNTITDNIIRNNNNDGIYLDESSYNMILNNDFSDNNAGINIDDSYYNIIINNTFNSDGISFSRGDLNNWITQRIEDNSINYKSIYYYKNIFNPFEIPLDAGQVILANCSNVSITNLHIVDVEIGLQLGHCKNEIITDNYFEQNFEGVKIWNSSNISIITNDFTDNILSGISIDCSSNISILSNNFSNSCYAIFLKLSNYNNISNNKIINGLASGIELIFSNNNEIYSNYIEGHSMYYMSFEIYYCHNNTIIQNSLVGGCLGIFMGESNDNTIIRTTIRDVFCEVIYLHDSFNNNIYHNNFFPYDYSNSACDNGDNYWDNGFPSGGNYWDNYGEKYPYASEIENSGLWNTSYDIDCGVNADMYPLIHPIDDIIPEISDITNSPLVQTTNGVVNFSCIVIDNIAVDKVQINITDPENLSQNFSMSRIPQSSTYIFQSTFSNIGTYSFLIWAVDKSNNSVCSERHYFEILQPDYIKISNQLGGDEVEDLMLGTNFHFTAYASAYNYTYGYMGPILVNWSINTTNSDATTTPINGFRSTFYSGSIDNSSATWIATDNYGNSDTVEFTIQNIPYYIDDNADSNWYDGTHVHTIQEALDNITFGQTAFVYNGTYNEEIVIDESINLIGQSKKNTIIQGLQIDSVVRINTDHVFLSSFTIENTSHSWYEYFSGIWIDSNHNIITNNIIENTSAGIFVEHSSYNNIENNTIQNNYMSNIQMNCSSDNIINNNEILFISNCTISESFNGIYLSYSTANIITNNTVVRTINGWGDGIRLSFSQENIVKNNYISISFTHEYHYGLGLVLSDSNRNIIEHNMIINNSYDGLNMYGSSNNTICKNTIENNGGIGINIWYTWIEKFSNDNLFYQNNLINNQWGNVADICWNIWNASYPNGGNYWSDFEIIVGPRHDGFSGSHQNETGSDGIIDQGGDEGGLNPYPIRYEINDWYPLMAPWS